MIEQPTLAGPLALRLDVPARPEPAKSDARAGIRRPMSRLDLCIHRSRSPPRSALTARGAGGVRQETQR